MTSTVEVTQPRATDFSSVDLSILVPTRNESENVATLVEQVNESMANFTHAWEIVFLDDSDDDTPDAVLALQRFDPRVSLLHRTPEQRVGGLGGAVAAGIEHVNGRVIVVMDGDLQHPPHLVRELSTMVLSGKFDIAIASRYVPGASSDGLDGFRRRVMSRTSVALSHLLIPKTRGIRDPMSGFFAVSRDRIAGTGLRPHGFKILMEILALAGDGLVAEVPFQLEARTKGDSKAGMGEIMHFVRHVGRLVRGRWSTKAIGRRVSSNSPLLAIVAVQIALSFHLLFGNSAFMDEATYIGGGEYELHVLLHGGPNMFFPVYFSGAPTIYPVLAAMANGIGGLHAARFMSLGFMVVATLLAYATARRLWGRYSGWLTAAIFVSTEGTQFLGGYATFDAMSLMLVALAAWLVVRFATTVRTSGVIYLAVPILVLANATKYASAIYDPIIFALAFFLILENQGVRVALRSSAALAATYALAAGAILAAVPNGYLRGIAFTTTSRAVSNDSTNLVLRESWSWVGAIACGALIAFALSAVLAWHRGSTWATPGINGILALAVFLAPVNQARIHTTTSLFKHVTFGAWFGSVAVGWLIQFASQSKWEKVRQRVVCAGVVGISLAVLVPLTATGFTQARRIDHSWINSDYLMKALGPLVIRVGGPILIDNSTVPSYYLQSEVPFPDWYNTYYLSYTPPRSTHRLTGVPAFKSAVRHGWFHVIALDWGAKPRLDGVIASTIHASKRYRWLGDYSIYRHSRNSTYVVWILKRFPA